MTRITRWTSALLLAGWLATPAAAQQTTLTLAHVAPPQTTFQDAAVRFRDRLAELSGGTIGVDIVPGAALGNLPELWAQVQSGALDMHLADMGAVIIMREARPFLVLFAPYLFTDQDHFRRFVASDVFDGMMDEVETAAGVVWLGYLGDRPPRVVTTRDREIAQPSDLQGLRIRTPQHPFIIATFEGWGAVPAPIEASELAIALRTGVVDGQDNGILDFIGAGYADSNKVFAPIDYIHSGIGLWMSPERWATFNEEQQGWLRHAAEEAGVAGVDLHAAQMEAAFAKLAELGVTVSEPDIAAFRASVQGWVEATDGQAWPEGLYATIGGL